MPYEKNAVIVLYSMSNDSNSDASVQVFPIINQRSFYSVTERVISPVKFNQRIADAKVGVDMKPNGSWLTLMVTEGFYHETGKWVDHLVFREDAARGESCFDDCYQPGYFEMKLRSREKTDFVIVAAAGLSETETEEVISKLPLATNDFTDLYEKEKRRIQNLLSDFCCENRYVLPNDWLNWLVFDADSFRVQAGPDGRRAVIAGYHWFKSWGRDTFISLPGLTLMPKKSEVARKTLLNFKDHCIEGLIPIFQSKMENLFSTWSTERFGLSTQSCSMQNSRMTSSSSVNRCGTHWNLSLRTMLKELALAYMWTSTDCFLTVQD
jgi:predicted glycogen debranching enzyme